VEPYLLGDATIGVIAQRLVRKLCDCKSPRSSTAQEKQFLGISTDEDLIIFDPVGCNNCSETGYFGRIGIYEIMPITPKIRTIISRRGTSDEIQKAALKEGMSTLHTSASKYVQKGITSILEMTRISIDE
ncbi:MAG: ATPase, T2SS/T4P/T4SS family, partial [Mobilitalea sp.]